MAKKTVRRNGQAGNNNGASRRCRQRRQCVEETHDLETHDLEIQLGEGDTTPVDQEDLADEHFVADLKEQCESSADPLTFVFSDLLGWNDRNRWQILSVIASLESGVTIRFQGQSSSFDCLFDAVLHVIEDDTDVTRFDRSRRAAIEVAVLIHGDSLDSACRRILQQFRQLGVTGLQLNSLMKDARNLAGDSSESESSNPTTLARRFLVYLVNHASMAEGQPVLRYFQDEFFKWERCVWQRVADKQVFARVIRFLQRDGSIEKVTERLARDVIKNLQGITLLDCWDQAMPLWIESEEPLNARQSPYLVFQNIMLNFQRLLDSNPNRRRRFDPRNFSQIVLPFEYDRRATCPLWERTIAEIFPALGTSDQRLHVLQEFMGWSLLHDDMSFERFLILVGKGANGKSTILHVWDQLLGPENVSHVPLKEFNSEFRLHEMSGKLANMSADMSRVEKVEEGLLKQFTSGDAVQVNRKYKEPVTLRPTAKLIFATNLLPPINDKSDGMWRRIIAMPFFVSFSGEQKDRHRAVQLREELPGIFNWAVVGLRRLHAQGDFTSCEICQKCADDHRFDSDPFMQFIEDECVMGSRQQVQVERRFLLNSYRQWCESNGRRPFSSSELFRRVADLDGVSDCRPGTANARQRVWRGIGLQQRMLGGRQS